VQTETADGLGGPAGDMRPIDKVRAEAHTGVQRTGREHKGSQATWEVRMSPAEAGHKVNPDPKPPGQRKAARSLRMERKESARTGTAEPKENEAKQEGHQQIGAAHGTEETGEPTRGTQ